MIVVLTGAPGAGKGTQAELLASREGYRKLSTGDALRKQVKLGTDIGRVAGSIMERGELVPDDVLLGIVAAELGAVQAGDVVLLDGYPRNVSQANALGGLSHIHPVTAAIHLEVPKDELISRLSGRRVCNACGATYHIQGHAPKIEHVCDKCGGVVVQRADDKSSAVATRLEVYMKNTQPVLDFYKKLGLYHQVSGVGDPELIYGLLRQVVQAL